MGGLERSPPREGLAGALCCAHPGCDLLTECVLGWPQQGLPLSPEDLLPFNPLFQDEILIVGASAWPGHHSEGMWGQEAERWCSLSPVLAASVLLLPPMSCPTHPTLPACSLQLEQHPCPQLVSPASHGAEQKVSTFADPEALYPRGPALVLEKN